MKKLFLALFALLLLVSSVSAAQIIVINDTEEKLFAIEQIILSGDLISNALSIKGDGELISGDNTKVYLFGPSKDFLVHNLAVNGAPKTVSFDQKGYFFLAEKGAFSFTANLMIRTIGQINLFVPGPVNELIFDLDHGYAIGGNRFGLFSENIIIQRSEKVSMIVDGSFRYSYAERNEFYYIINFQAFGSSLGGYQISLKNNEVISSVTGALKWEQTGNTLLLDLESDKSTVSIQGFFNSNNLRIPLDEDRHHVVIESDAEKRITISTPAQEIDVSESTIPPIFPNARAFLASPQDSFSITIKDLNILPSLAASVRRATNKIAITQKGSVLGEMSYSYANTGVDYLAVEVEGTPLYASTGGGAVKLTQDQKLLLALPKSTFGNLDLVYFTTRIPLKFINLIEIPLAQTDIPITTATTTIFLPKNFFVVNTFGAKGGTELPAFKSVLLFLVIIGGIALLLIKDYRFMMYYIILSIGIFYFDYRLFIALLAITLFLIIKKYVKQTELKKSLKWILIGAAVLVIVGLIVFVFVSFVGRVRTFGTVQESVAADYAMVEEAEAPSFKGMQRVGEGSGAISVPTRTGVLPVKLELPQLGKTITVTNHLVTPENQVELKVLMIATWLKYLLYLIALFAGLKAYKMYRKS